jgi:long-chain acyl-CoA synthetase
VTTLVALNLDVVKKLIAEGGEQVPSDAASLLAHPLVGKRIESKLAEVNAKLGSWEQVKYFRVLPRELTEADGELTPTLKVKRKVVSERYRELIEE